MGGGGGDCNDWSLRWGVGVVMTVLIHIVKVMKPAVMATKPATTENAHQKSQRRAAKRRRI